MTWLATEPCLDIDDLPGVEHVDERRDDQYDRGDTPDQCRA